MLRADLNRVLSDSFVAPGAMAATERAEREVASRYDTKLAEIEGAMRELVGENRSLKDELRRWTAEGTDFASSSHPIGGRGRAPAGLAAAGSFDAASAKQHGDEAASAADSLMRTSRPSSSASTGGASCGLAFGGSGLSGSARTKLDDAKTSLHVAGSAAPQAVGTRPAGIAPSQSDRATTSQNKARLQDIQRRRAELVKKKQLVRNYNVKDGAE